MTDIILYRNRRDQYRTIHGLMPEETAGATDLECEMDLRGLAGGGAYALPGYCSQMAVPRCSECSLCNYGRDCHNQPVAI